MDEFDVDQAYEDTVGIARELMGSTDDPGQLWEANELVNRALSMRLRDAYPWLLKAQIQCTLGDDLAALACVETALRLEPRMAEAHYWHAAVLTDLDRFDDALRAVARAFRNLGPDDQWLTEDLYYEKALILDSVGKQDAARGTLESGLERFPDSAILRAGVDSLQRRRVRASLVVLEGGRSGKA